MFGWIVFNYIVVVASSYITEYFLQTSGGDISNNATLIAYSYSAGSSAPLLVGANCIYISVIDTPSFPFENATFLEKFGILSLGTASPLRFFHTFPDTVLLGFEITNTLIDVASVVALIILLSKLSVISIARSGVCVLSTSYAIQIFGGFLLGHTLAS
jgi:hypothetical protein